MNALVNATTVKTMSSREIAELTTKTHDNVLKLVRSLIDGGVVKNTIPHEYQHPQNKQWYTEYFSDKRDSLVIVARLSPEFTAAVVDRWQELEVQVSLPRELTRLEILEMALQAERRVIALESKVEVLQPQAEAFDRLCNATGLFGVREAAKALKCQQSQLTTWLVQHKWAYRDARQTLQPYADKIKAQLVSEILTKPIIGSDGCERVFTQLRITTKGMAKLSEALGGDV